MTNNTGMDSATQQAHVAQLLQMAKEISKFDASLLDQYLWQNVLQAVLQ